MHTPEDTYLTDVAKFVPRTRSDPAKLVFSTKGSRRRSDWTQADEIDVRKGRNLPYRHFNPLTAHLRMRLGGVAPRVDGSAFAGRAAAMHSAPPHVRPAAATPSAVPPPPPRVRPSPPQIIVPSGAPQEMEEPRGLTFAEVAKLSALQKPQAKVKGNSSVLDPTSATSTSTRSTRASSSGDGITPTTAGEGISPTSAWESDAVSRRDTPVFRAPPRLEEAAIPPPPPPRVRPATTPNTPPPPPPRVRPASLQERDPTSATNMPAVRAPPGLTLRTEEEAAEFLQTPLSVSFEPSEDDPKITEQDRSVSGIQRAPGPLGRLLTAQRVPRCPPPDFPPPPRPPSAEATISDKDWRDLVMGQLIQNA